MDLIHFCPSEAKPFGYKTIPGSNCEAESRRKTERDRNDPALTSLKVS